MTEQLPILRCSILLLITDLIDTNRGRGRPTKSSPDEQIEANDSPTYSCDRLAVQPRCSQLCASWASQCPDIYWLISGFGVMSLGGIAGVDRVWFDGRTASFDAPESSCCHGYT